MDSNTETKSNNLDINYYINKYPNSFKGLSKAEQENKFRSLQGLAEFFILNLSLFKNSNNETKSNSLH